MVWELNQALRDFIINVSRTQVQCHGFSRDLALSFTSASPINLYWLLRHYCTLFVTINRFTVTEECSHAPSEWISLIRYT